MRLRRRRETPLNVETLAGGEYATARQRSPVYALGDKIEGVSRKPIVGLDDLGGRRDLKLRLAQLDNRGCYLSDVARLEGIENVLVCCRCLLLTALNARDSRIEGNFRHTLEIIGLPEPRIEPKIYRHPASSGSERIESGEIPMLAAH